MRSGSYSTGGMAAALLVILALAACQSTADKSSGPAATNAEGGPAESATVKKKKRELVPLAMTRDVAQDALARYKAVYIPPVNIAPDVDAFDDDVKDADKKSLAQQLQDKFKAALLPQFKPALTPGPGVAQLELNLDGVKTSNSVLSTGMRVLPIGMAMSVVRGSIDKPAHFTGSVTISGKLSDSVTHAPLAHFSGTAQPRAYNLTSGLGSLRAAELGVERAAQDIGAQLQGKNPSADAAADSAAPATAH